MPRIYPYYQVEYFTIAQPGPGNLWAWASDGSQWVHFNFFIHIPPKINTHSVTAFPDPKEEVPITVSPSISESVRLFGFRYELVAQPCTNYCGLFLPYIFLLQQGVFHISVVGVCRFIRCRDGYLIIGISPKRSGQ